MLLSDRIRLDATSVPYDGVAHARRGVLLVFLIPVLLAGATARAQTSFTASAVSEFSTRGLSLSRGRAVPQLRIDHDTASGWYGGLFAARAVLRATRSGAALTGYGGYARSLASGLAWDAGISRTVFRRDAAYSYTEVHAGISSEHLGVRLFLSPDFYRAGRTAYIELSGAEPLGERWRLTARAGLMHRFAGPGARARIDLRAALAADIGDAVVELGLQARQRDPRLRAPHARALFASASIGF
jgi:uncharacterized protein (TIGR02001 family)